MIAVKLGIPLEMSPFVFIALFISFDLEAYFACLLLHFATTTKQYAQCDDDFNGLLHPFSLF